MLGTVASNTVADNNSRGGRGRGAGGTDRTDGTSQNNNNSGVSRLGSLDRGGRVGQEELGMPLLGRRLGGDESSSNVPREADV